MGAWDAEALWLKARVYIDKANSLEGGDPQFGLFSTLALELLARAALSKIHPAFNADPTDVKNLFYAFGFPIVEQPRSIPVHSVYLRLEKLVPDIGKPQREFCDYMTLLRNEELHTGEAAFARVNVREWLPRFYAVCKVLCKHLGKSLQDFLGDELAASAEEMVAAHEIAQEKRVRDKVSEHKKTFEAQAPDKMAQLKREAELRVALGLKDGSVARPCPACGTRGILNGKLIREREPIYSEGELVVDQDYMATDFTCFACGLHLGTVDEIMIVGPELRFTEQAATSLHERFQAELEDEYENM